MNTQIVNSLKNILLGLFIGMVIMFNQVCKQKDFTISLVLKGNSAQAATVETIPKNLPIITSFKK